MIDDEAEKILNRDGDWVVLKNKAARNPLAKDPWQVFKLKRPDIFAVKFEGGEVTQVEIVEVWPNTSRGLKLAVEKNEYWDGLYRKEGVRVVVRNLYY